jgi:dihydroorotase
MNPPIRDRRHQEALWQAVASGVVDVLGSDHAPHTIEEKRQTYPLSPAGMTGVQTILPIMLNHVHQGRLSLGRVVELLATNPARIWGIEGYGEIKLGGLANLTVIDQHRQVEITNDWIASKCKWTPFAGMKVTGWPTATIVNGLVAMRDGEILGSPAGHPLVLSV